MKDCNFRLHKNSNHMHTHNRNRKAVELELHSASLHSASRPAQVPHTTHTCKCSYGVITFLSRVKPHKDLKCQNWDWDAWERLYSMVPPKAEEEMAKLIHHAVDLGLTSSTHRNESLLGKVLGCSCDCTISFTYLLSQWL